MKKQRLKAVALTTVLSAGALIGSLAMAQDLGTVLQASQAKTTLAQESQKRIDRLAQETDDLTQQYKAQIKLIDDLRVFNAQMEKQVSRQLTVVQELDASIDKVTVIERQVQPLIFRMLDALEQFVKLDKPFQLEERLQRIEMLRANQDRADISVSEKFRQVLEAYKIESAYGNTIEAYEGTLPVDGQPRQVNILRVGRVALMYQTTDTKHCGTYNPEQRQWVALDSSYNSSILKGLRIARNQASKDIMSLTVQAPETAK
jgi:Protein of unknown function (DUF3450)